MDPLVARISARLARLARVCAVSEAVRPSAYDSEQHTASSSPRRVWPVHATSLGGSLYRNCTNCSMYTPRSNTAPPPRSFILKIKRYTLRNKSVHLSYVEIKSGFITVTRCTVYCSCFAFIPLARKCLPTTYHRQKRSRLISWLEFRSRKRHSLLKKYLL